MVPNGWLHKQIGEIASIQVGRDLVEDKYSEISTTEYKYPVYSRACPHFKISAANLKAAV